MKKLDSYLRLVNGYSDENIENQIKDVIDYFFDYIKNNSLDPNNEEDYRLFTETMEQIFELEMELYGLSKNSVELVFTDDENYHGNFSYSRVFDKDKKQYVSNKSIISISVPTTLEFMSYNLSARLNAFKGVINTLFHEIRHARQFNRYMYDISSNENLMFAKEFLFSDEFSNTSIGEVYERNHNSFSMENDASSSASKRVLDFLDYRFVSSIDNISVKNVDYYLSDLVIEDEKGRKLVNKNQYINDTCDRLVIEEPYLLDKFPILKKEYNSDGSKIKLKDLVLNMYKEISQIQKVILNSYDREMLIMDIRSMYNELIYRRLKANNEEEIKELVSLIKEENFTILLNSISEYYRQERLIKGQLSKRKYDIKSRIDKDENYLKIFGNGYIQVQTPQGIKLIKQEDYIKEYLSDIDLGKHKDYVYHRLPKYGYYILQNGARISIVDFINKYLLPEIKEGMTKSDINKIFKKYIKSSIGMDYQVELEKINAEYQEKKSLIDNIINEYGTRMERKF